MKFKNNLSDRSLFSRTKLLRTFSPLLLLLMISTACKTIDQLQPDPTPTPTATPTPSPTPIPTPTPGLVATSNAELYFKLDAAWDSGTSYAAQAPSDVNGVIPTFPSAEGCQIPLGSAPSQVTCTFSLPENQLYQSSLKMRVGSSDSSTCTYVRFYPYFYRGEGPVSPPSVAGSPTPVPYYPTWAVDTNMLPLAPVSCLSFVPGLPVYNDATTSPFYTSALAGEQAPIYATQSCYNGAGTTISGFPLVKYMGVQTATTQELTFPVASANSLHQLSNRWVANDFPAVTAVTGKQFTGYPAYTKEYASNSANDYVAQCLDQFGMLVYEAKIVITAKSNVAGAAASTYLTWRAAPGVTPTATPIPVPTPTATPTVSTPTPTPSPIPATVFAGMYFELDAAWDTGTPQVFTTQIPATVGATPGTAIDSCKIPYGASTGTTQTCKFYVPDTQLYFSNLRMRMGSYDNVKCKYVKFYPYFYTLEGLPHPTDATSGAGLMGAGGTSPSAQTISWLLPPVGGGALTTATCYDYYAGSQFATDLGTPASEMSPRYATSLCYNGPATTIAGFPFVKSVYQETTYNQELVFPVVSSSNTKLMTSSRWVANDLPAGSRNSTFGSPDIKEYYPGSMNDYVVQCIDENGALNYETTITISGGTAGTPANVYKTWR